MDIELLIKATRKQSNMFIVKDRLELFKILESNKDDIDSVLTSYQYLIDSEPDNKELKKELKELIQLIKHK